MCGIGRRGELACHAILVQEDAIAHVEFFGQERAGNNLLQERHRPEGIVNFRPVLIQHKAGMGPLAAPCAAIAEAHERGGIRAQPSIAGCQRLRFCRDNDDVIVGQFINWRERISL